MQGKWMALLLAMGLMLSACESEGPAEQAGEQVDEAVENAGEKVEEAADSVGDAVEEAGDKVREQTDSAN